MRHTVKYRFNVAPVEFFEQACFLIKIHESAPKILKKKLHPEALGHFMQSQVVLQVFYIVDESIDDLSPS